MLSLRFCVLFCTFVSYINLFLFNCCFSSYGSILQLQLLHILPKAQTLVLRTWNSYCLHLMHPIFVTIPPFLPSFPSSFLSFFQLSAKVDFFICPYLKLLSTILINANHFFKEAKNYEMPLYCALLIETWFATFSSSIKPQVDCYLLPTFTLTSGKLSKEFFNQDLN